MKEAVENGEEAVAEDRESISGRDQQ